MGKAQWDVVTALLVLVDLYRGQKQVEEREAEEAGCQPGVGGQGGSASASREPWPTSLLESLYRTPGQGQEKLPVG